MRARSVNGALLIVSGAVAVACGSEDNGSGGAASGGAASGGAASGGAASGGASNAGGAPNGGRDSGGSDSGGTGGKATGGMGGGSGGTIDPPPPPTVLGAWERTCDDLGMGGALNACVGGPWTLMLGETVLGGPSTVMSDGGPCGDDQSKGTFTYADETLELFNWTSSSCTWTGPG